MKHSSKKGLASVALLSVAALGAFTYTFYHLDVGEHPQLADVIIVAEGQGIRGERAVELLEAGYSRYDKIIVSPLNSGLRELRRQYLKDGADNHQLVEEPQATSTWTNATNSIEVMLENGWTSAIIVTSDFHTLRTKLSFERAAKGKDLDFTYVSAYRQTGDGQDVTYLNDPINRKMAFNELWKLPGYLIGLYRWIDL